MYRASDGAKGRVLTDTGERILGREVLERRSKGRGGRVTVDRDVVSHEPSDVRRRHRLMYNHGP